MCIKKNSCGDAKALDIVNHLVIDHLQKWYNSLEVVSTLCQKVDFLLYSKWHTIIGFENNAGGFELRNENFKGRSSP
jgi:hypothetical protein